MNIELAKQVLAAAEHSYTGVPDKGMPTFEMSSWVAHRDLDDTEEEYPRLPLKALKEGDCGSSACLSGYVAILRAPPGCFTDGDDIYDSDNNYLGDFAHFATKELEITHMQGSCLFFTTNASALARLRRLIEHPDTSPDKLLRINIPEDEDR